MQGPAGWYARNPKDETRLSFWDGQAWTKNTLVFDIVRPAASNSGSGCLPSLGWIAVAILVLVGIAMAGSDSVGTQVTGWVLFLGTIGLVVWRKIVAPRRARNNQSPTPMTTVPPQPVTPLRVAESPIGDHLAFPPSGTAVEPWGSTRTRVEVVGEAYREDDLRGLFDEAGLDISDGAELQHVAEVVADFTNPHDGNAVSIWVNGFHVGYLDRDTAREWAPTVRRLAQSREHLRVPARIWAAERPGRVNGRVTITMPQLHEIKPANRLPAEPYVVLPRGSKVQVTKEEQHMDVLTPLAKPSGVTLAVTLHAIHEIRARSSVETVEVRVGGERVGILSAASAGNLLPLVKYIEARGKVAVSRATLAGNALKADVTLDVAKAQEVDSDWLAALGPEVPGAPRVARPAYEWDDTE